MTGRSTRVQTWVERTVAVVGKVALRDAAVAIIIGRSGLGKTTGARHYAEETSALYTVASPGSFGAAAVMEDIGLALGIATTGPLKATERRISAALRRPGAPLVVIDDAQNLTPRALRALRRLRRRTRVALLLVGGPDVQGRPAPFARCASKGHRHDLPSSIPRADVAAIARLGGPVSVAAELALHREAQGPRGLFAVVALCRVAHRQSARRRDRRLFEWDIERARRRALRRCYR